jgi:hypothetical protein
MREWGLLIEGMWPALILVDARKEGSGEDDRRMMLGRFCRNSKVLAAQVVDISSYNN